MHRTPAPRCWRRFVKQRARSSFSNVIAPAEAKRRFAAAIDLSPLAAETVTLADALGRVLAVDVAAPTDVPAFDRSGVDGFAVRAADTAGAGERAPRRLLLNAEVIACGHPPALDVGLGNRQRDRNRRRHAARRRCGGDGRAHRIDRDPARAGHRGQARRRAGAVRGFAGSDMARGETVLRRGQRIGSREIGMLAACGIAAVPVVRQPQVAVLSTGDELVPPGTPLPPAGVYDSNGAIVAAAVTEAGGVAIRYGAFPDHEATLEAAVRRALARMRHGGALGRHLEGRRRPVLSNIVAARPARRSGAWRRAQARQAAVPGGMRRQADRRAAGLSDLGDLHLPRLRGAGHPRPRRTAGGGGANRDRDRAGADRIRTGPSGVRAGGACPRPRTGRWPSRSRRARAR